MNISRILSGLRSGQKIKDSIVLGLIPQYSSKPKVAPPHSMRTFNR